MTAKKWDTLQNTEEGICAQDWAIENEKSHYVIYFFISFKISKKKKKKYTKWVLIGMLFSFLFSQQMTKIQFKANMGIILTKGNEKDKEILVCLNAAKMKCHAVWI